MSSEAPKVTIDFLIELLRQVIAENPSHGQGKAATAPWGPDTLLEDTGFGSYDLVEIIFRLEDHFGIEIDYNANNAINDVKTIGGLRDEISRLVDKKQTA